MLSLNIKSSSYMCLDIDPDSVIHKHLCSKLHDLDKDQNNGDGLYYNPILKCQIDYGNVAARSKHNLTMLPSFHISLEPPFTEFDDVGDSITVRTDWFNIRALIGEIILADIHISKKDKKRSAWIPLHPDLIDEFMPPHHNHKHYSRPNDRHTGNGELLHISLANLTGNPHDSIARPEDCIVDTITA